ncbi:MAG: CapA family protein [Bacteroidales bacterium]|nr:CapA family protein [Bacteroidales bacterium]
MSTNISILCMGDAMPGGVLHYETSCEFCDPDLLTILRQADIRVATLETAVGDEPHFDKEKMARDKDVIYCPTKNLYRLKELGIDVVSLANNHAWDLGENGIIQTFKELDKLGIKYCGAGLNLADASKPAVIKVKGKSVAFIAYCDNQPGTCGYVPEATDTHPGINIMKENNIRESITKLKDKFDYLFVMMHWGKEYYYYPTPQVNSLAKKMINWGADGIIGSHSHQIQPTIVYHSKPIIFSLGNFFFPDRFITSPRSTYYPEKKPELNNMPVTHGYPMVDEPTFKIWRPVARTGQIINITLGNGVLKISRILTCLDKHSHISVYKGHLPALFKLSHLLVKIPGYSRLFFGMRGCRFIKKKIKGEL